MVNISAILYYMVYLSAILFSRVGAAIIITISTVEKLLTNPHLPC